MTRSRQILAVLSFAALAPFAAAQGAPLYDVQSIGSLTFVNEVGPAGHVVGTRIVSSFPNTIESAVVIPPGQSEIVLPLLPGYARSTARDVDAAGNVVGALAPLQPGMTGAQPALWTPQVGGGYSVQLLALPAGLAFGSANSINEVGDIVGDGYVSFPGGVVGVLYSTSGPGTSLAGVGMAGLTFVNDARIAVDISLPARYVDLATLAVGTTTVPPPQNGVPFIGATARALTNNGRIAGTAGLFSLSSCRTYAVTLRPGVGWEVSNNCGTNNVATDVNEGGDRLELDGGVLRLVLDGQSPVALDSLIVAPPGTGPWTTNSVGYIADDRSIVCQARDLSTGVNQVVRLTPRVTCQADLGFGGPGNGRLTVCGGDLSLGTTAELALIGATPSSTAYLGVSFASNPTPIFGGTAVPFPAQLLVPLPIDGAGVGRIAPVNGGFGPFSIYVQGAWVDASLPQFIGLSNAVRIDVLP
jgi:hypothetical protein